MKIKGLLIIILMLSVAELSAQSMALTELVALSNKNSWTEVDRALTAKGWVYHSSSKGDENNYDMISWSYKKDSYSDKAHAWFHAFEMDGKLVKVSYDVFNKPSFLVIQKGIATSGYILINSDIADDEVKTNYESKSHTLTVGYSKRAKDDYEYSQTSLTAYSVVVKRKVETVDNLNGFQQYSDDEGNKIEVFLKDGKAQGILKKYNPDGVLILTRNFLNGNITGLSKEFDNDGDIITEANYLDGELDGNYMRYYYPDKGIVITWAGKMLNGKKNGLWVTKKFEKENEYLLDFESYENDVLNGAFKESVQDSIIYGHYRNGELDGGYKIFRSLITYLTGNRTGDSANSIKITEGYYFQGMKTGSWKNYSLTGTLLSEGKYYNNERDGDWKFYHDNYKEDDKAGAFSGKLFKIAHYDKGMKNGKTIQYSYTEDIPVKCDLSVYPGKTPLDTCYDTRYFYEPTITYYKDNLLHGPFEVRDSADVVITKGVYVNDNRDGVFTEAYIVKDENGHRYYMYEEGLYRNGKREGQWKSYRHHAFITQTYQYKDGLLDGKKIYYNSAGKRKLEIDYVSDSYKIISLYDSLAERKLRSYKILSESETAITCEYLEYSDAGYFSQVYFLPKHSNNFIYPKWFDDYFQNQTSELIDETPPAYPDGKYALYDTKAVLLEEGSYKRKEQVGKWTSYYPGTGVYSEKQFTNAVPGVEYFFLDNSSVPYSGELKQYHPNGKLKFEIDISKGVRNGKSKYFTEDGKNLKTEKYKNGILQ